MWKKILLLVFVFVPALLHAQDLTGVWRGTFYNEYEYLFTGAKYRYEVQLKNSGRGVTGVTYSYQTTRFYGKASMVGVWFSSNGELTIKEDKMLDLKITGGGDGCLMTCYLTYHKEGTHEYLEGTYSSVNMRNDTLPCGGGVVRLEKVPDSDFELEDFLQKKTVDPEQGKLKPGQSDFLIKKTPSQTAPNSAGSAKKPAPQTGKPSPPPSTAKKVDPPKTVKPSTEKSAAQQPDKTTTAAPTPSETKPKEAPKKIPAPPVLTTRHKDLVETIVTREKFLEISFYDNGEIDGDTISVYDNNRKVVSRAGLSARPITIKVLLDDDDPEHEVVMVAENMGSIPPNTSLMIVKAGSQRYTVRLSSTEQKNATVRFRYDPKSPN
jgi:hypothetical protein